MTKEKKKVGQHNNSRTWIKVFVAVIAFSAVFSFFASISHRLVVFRSDFLADIMPKVLIDLTNVNRGAYRIGYLSENQLLKEAAQRKADDMASKGYFAHNSPEGLTPWYWMENVGYDFLFAGENLAVNFSDSNDVVWAWMDSPGHRANILNDRFTEIGIATSRGFYKGQETTFVVQMFGLPKSSSFALSPTPAPSQESSALEEVNREIVEIGSEETEDSKFLAVQVLDVNAQNTSDAEVLDISEAEDDSEKVAGLNENANVLPNKNYSSTFERLISSPSMLLSLTYLFLGFLILIFIVLILLIEINRHHFRHIFYGIALILLILILYFVYRNSLDKTEVLSRFFENSYSPLACRNI